MSKNKADHAKEEAFDKITMNTLKKNNYLVIGRAGMDLYPDPPGTKTEEATNFFSCLGGSSANIAASIIRLGGTASQVTAVSDDAIGRFTLNEMAKYGIQTEYVTSVSGGVRTSVALVESRMESHQSVIYRNDAADFQMSVDDVENIDYAAFGYVVATGTSLAMEPSRSATFRAFELAKEAGVPIVLDLDYRNYSWLSSEVASQMYSRAAQMSDIVIGNDLEFNVLSGNDIDGLSRAKQLSHDSNRIVVYKMGEEGSITFISGESFKTEIFPVTPLKPTGAGDSFMGGFLTSLANDLPIEDCVRRGSACAAIVVSRVGCAPAMPTIEELEQFLANPNQLPI